MYVLYTVIAYAIDLRIVILHMMIKNAWHTTTYVHNEAYAVYNCYRNIFTITIQNTRNCLTVYGNRP